MIFKQQPVGNQYDHLIEKIKNDLTLTFQKKGVSILKVGVDTKSDNLKVQVCIKEQ